MPLDVVPFDRLTFSISKPAWGTSTLVLLRGPDGAFQLRAKHFDGGKSTDERVAPYTVEAASGLDGWIRTLGFYDQGVSNKPIACAGLWILRVTRPGEDEFVQEGTHYPESFPDLLNTMVSLGLPGFENQNIDAFLGDFCECPKSSIASRGAMPDFDRQMLESGLEGLSGADAQQLQSMLQQIVDDPGETESVLRSQFGQLPESTKTQMLEFVRSVDPDHLEWWWRILFG